MKHELPLDFGDTNTPHAMLLALAWPLAAALFYVAVSGALFFMP